MDHPGVGVLDYIVLVAILFMSVLIGVYHGFKDRIKLYVTSVIKSSTNRVQVKDMELKESHIKYEKHNENFETELESKKDNTKEYLSASSSMGILPITFSLLASFFSATGLVGTPTEVYQYGIQYWIAALGCATTPIIGAFVTGPFFIRQGCQSVFEYIEVRYKSKNVRVVGMLCYLLRNFISASIFTYGPATALSLILNLNQNITIGLIGFIGTFYTAVGGMKAVIWTDLFQASIMLISVAFIVIKGIYDVDGVTNLLKINKDGGRLNFFDFNLDPFIRQSFWSLYFGGAIYFSISYCFDQQMIQRFRAAKTKKHAQIALLLNTPVVLIYLSLCCLIGLVIYANYHSCDPLLAGQISNSNQYSSYFVLHNLHMIPGVVGLFLGALFCSSLSSLASCLNSLTVIIWQDFLKFFKVFHSLSDKKSLTLSKMIVIVCGLIGTLLSYLISISGNNLVQLNNSLNGTFNAPLIGLFILSMFFSCTNKYGAIAGTLTGLLANLWLSIGAFIVDPKYPKLVISVSQCSNDLFISKNFSMVNTKFDGSDPTELEGFTKFYALSYMWYTAFGTLITIISGLLVSICTGGLRNRVESKLMVYDLSRFFKLN